MNLEKRNALINIYPQIYENEKKSNSSKNVGQIDIFSLAPEEKKFDQFLCYLSAYCR